MPSKHLVAYMLAALWVAIPAYAKDAAPVAQLEQTQKEIQDAQSTQTKIQQQAQAVEAELTGLQAQLVKLAVTAQKSEADLTASEDRQRLLASQLDAKNKEFKTRQSHLSVLVQAAISLSHTPPEAMIMMPGDVTRTMKAARALKMASEAVKTETTSLGLQLTELQHMEAKLAHDHAALAAKQADLDTQQKDLVSKLTERKSLQKRLGLQAKETQTRLTTLAKKTEDLQDLIEKVEQDRKPKAAAENERRKAKSHSFADAKGHIRTPVSGKLTEKFGTSTGKNDSAKGITIQTRSRAAVTAPFDGEVVFTGPFLKYGKMVIIHHSDNFHTLLAGLEKIDVEVGQFLLEGEPIGAMGEDADATELYVELRKDNQPIDPAPWMNALTKRK